MKRKGNRLKLEEIEDYAEYLKNGEGLKTYRWLEEKAAEWAEKWITEFNPKKERTLKILSLAHGIGWMSIPLIKKLQEKGFKTELTAIEKLESVIEVAKEKAKEENVDIKFLHQDLTDLDLPENSFDFAIGSFFFFFLSSKDLTQLAGTLHKVIRNGGGFWFLNSNRTKIMWYLTKLNTSEEKGYEVATIEYDFKPEEIRDLFGQNGFWSNSNFKVKKKWLGFLTITSGIVTKP